MSDIEDEHMEDGKVRGGTLGNPPNGRTNERTLSFLERRGKPMIEEWITRGGYWNTHADHKETYNWFFQWCNDNAHMYFAAREWAKNEHWQISCDLPTEKTEYRKYLDASATFWKSLGFIKPFEQRKHKPVDRTPRYMFCYCCKGTGRGNPPEFWSTNIPWIDKEYVRIANLEYYDKWHKSHYIEGPAPKAKSKTTFQKLIDMFDEKYDTAWWQPDLENPRERKVPPRSELRRACLDAYRRSSRLDDWKTWKRALAKLHFRYYPDIFAKLEKSICFNEDLFPSVNYREHY